MLRNLWIFRYFMLSSISGDLKGRFVRSYFGGMWFILHPLAQALIFSIVLSQIMKARIPGVENEAAYSIYLLSGLAAWGLFTEILTRSINIFIEQAAVMKKIAFPRLCLPIIVWGTAVINHLLLLLAIAIIFMFFGHIPSISWVFLIFGIILISMLAFGLGVMLGVINVFSRDVAQVMTVIVQLWFWLTPIVYTTSIVPEKYHGYIALNPMTHIVGLYQNAMLFHQPPTFSTVLYLALLGIVMVLASFIIFRRASSEIVDAL